MSSTESGQFDQGNPKSTPQQNKQPAKGTGTEAERAGGIKPAQRQADKDWEESAKESGD